MDGGEIFGRMLGTLFLVLIFYIRDIYKAKKEEKKMRENSFEEISKEEQDKQRNK